MTLEWIHPDELKNHPTNLSIYGDTPDPEFLASVKEHGVFEDHPIGYVMDGDFRRIVSGHRRCQAARIAKLDMVPCVRLKDIEGDPLAIEERIILSNRGREKSNEQKAREAAKLAEIESKRAAEREKSGTLCSIGTKGSTRQKVAESLDVSESTAERLITAGTALEEAESKGQKRKVAAIKKGLKKSVRAGARAAKPKAESAPAAADKKAASLLAKITADFNRAAENLAPLVREWDAMKAKDSAFTKKHAQLLGHHSRLFQLCDDGKRALKRLNDIWAN